MKRGLIWLLLAGVSSVSAQSQTVDFDAVDSLIATTPEIEMCEKNGKEDLRFFSKTPERYANFKQEFFKQMNTIPTPDSASHFFCDITVEVNCKGIAGNYDFAIEPRTFKQQDYVYFSQLIELINSLRNQSYVPAYYLGENVNSRVSFRLAAKQGKWVLQ